VAQPLATLRQLPLSVVMSGKMLDSGLRLQPEAAQASWT
jgi:hypothetical protein